MTETRRADEDHAPDRHAPRRRRGPVRVAVAALSAVLLLSGCAVRLETPPPTAPSPDAVEIVRARTVADALALELQATRLAADPANPASAAMGLLADFSAQHAAQLGGVYDSGLPSPTPSATPSAVPEVLDPAGLLLRLAVTARSARADADEVADGALAQLLASISVSRERLVDEIAAALGAPVPTADEIAQAAGPTQDTPDTSGTPDDSVTPGDVATGPPSPAGVPTRGLVQLAAAEDQAGYAYEVLAARTGDQLSRDAESAALRHRSRAEAWALASGVDETPDDPRRPAYALPAGLDDPATATALAQGWESTLTQSYASLVADALPGERGALAEAMRTSDVEAAAWGAPPTAFPGLPGLAS